MCKLNKAIYGLKQAPRSWYEKLTQSLLQFGFTSSKCDNSLFFYCKQGIFTYALIYVDDIHITGSISALIHDLINKLHNAFALKKLGQPSYFIGIEVKFCSNGSLLLTQSKYIKDLLAKVKMNNANGVPTPMLSTFKQSNHGTNHFSDPQLYMSIVGVLQL